MEEEANRRTAIILTAKWNLDEDLIRIVIDFHEKNQSLDLEISFPLMS